MNLEDYPLVSVIVPCYNHEKYIEQCLYSILNQTYPKLQLILIDDGSTDRSFEIAKEILTVPNAVAIRQQNQGLPRTVNRALSEFALGEYIVILASDDWLDHNAISIQLACFQSNKALGFVFGKAIVMSNEGRALYEIPSAKRQKHITFDELLIENYVPALAAMTKRSALDEVGLYDINSKIEDWDMWLRLGMKYQFQFIDAVLGYYRQHPHQTSTKHDIIAASEIYILDKYRDQPVYQKAYDAHILRKIRNILPTDRKAAFSLLVKNAHLIYTREYCSLVAKLLLGRY